MHLPTTSKPHLAFTQLRKAFENSYNTVQLQLPDERLKERSSITIAYICKTSRIGAKPHHSSAAYGTALSRTARVRPDMFGRQKAAALAADAGAVRDQVARLSEASLVITLARDDPE